MIPAGRLRHRVRLQALQVDVDSDDGHAGESWADVGAGLVPAEIAPLSGRELIAAQAVQSKVSTRIRIRWQPGVVASMRIVHRDDVYDVEAVLEDPNSGRRWLTLLCSRGVNDG